MSYILDALRKAEQDRKRGDIPGIEDLQEARPAEKKSLSWGWIALGIANIALLGLLFWPESDPDTPGSVASVGPVAVQQPVIVKQGKPESVAPVLPTPAPPVEAVAVNKMPETTPDEPQMPEESIVYPQKAEETAWADIDDRPLQPIPPPPAKVQESKVSRQAAVKKPTKHRESPGKATFLKEQETMEALNAPETPSTNQPLSEQSGLDMPIWPQVSTGLFSQLQGNLRMDVHVFADLPEERFVLINLTKYHEGEEMREGPYVVEITDQGVILELSGDQFLLPAN
ncbi:MAG: general secretion pathway protein GspB [Gammaproteobacteria bacterium]